MKSVAAYVSIDLLKDNANVLEAHLQLLLHAALRYAAKPEVFDLVRIHTNDTILNAEIQTLWYGAGFLLDSDGFRDSLALHISSNENRAAQAIVICPSVWWYKSRYSLSIVRECTIVFNRYYRPLFPSK
ncbi:MAG: hypothetical protein H0X47_07625 [Nitrospirales bacterium]|nr:hypothetical protein [Nitrospirales bacterium]